MSGEISNLKVSQFTYCSICKYNYEPKKEYHIYTKRHKECVMKILDKYLIKVNETKNTLINPVVKDANYEREAKVWCCFCECEVPKHATIKSTTVCGLGFLSHLKCSNHLKMAKLYFWKNRVDKGMLDKYLMAGSEFDKFLNVAINAVNVTEISKNATHQSEVQRIIASDKLREQTLLEASVSTETLSNSNDKIGEAFTSSTNSMPKSNIFTGMTPPWLQPDEPTSTVLIGPDISVYQKHLELVKKSKLPPKRVGKDFNREEAFNQDWLPSFGQVWNNSCRNSSKKKFNYSKRKNEDGANTSFSKPHKLKPYSTKKYEL